MLINRISMMKKTIFSIKNYNFIKIFLYNSIARLKAPYLIEFFVPVPESFVPIP